MVNVDINELKQIPLSKQRIEICERKGLGHPDFICDSIMDKVSVALSKEYLKRFGSIMHHNIDKGLLVAGEVERRFGGGRVIKPMLLVFGDRATFNVDSEEVPVNEIAIKTAKEWFRKNLRFVDPETHVKYQVELKRGAEALVDIFKRKGEYLGANDTSAAVGYAPMTETEKLVLEVEKFLNGKEFKKQHPETGEDVKVMALRKDKEINLTIAMAFIDKFIDSENTYFKRKEEVLEELNQFVKSKTSMEKVKIELNTLDMKGRGMAGMYLTVLGTSADDGDCGQVGRGNRVNGVIPLNRPVGSEAAAGKNPVSHVGKIYTILTYRIANEVYEKVSGIQEVYVWLLSQIGKPINLPKIASVQLILEPNTSIKDISSEVRDIVKANLDNLNKFCMDLAYGKYPIC